MQTWIIEDEPLAAERLEIVLRQVAPDIEMAGTTDSARQTVEWLRSRPLPDFLLMDIHLADGSAFDIFRMAEVNLPVIFTTAYDKYALQAFDVMGIDYLLKPVTYDQLQRAIRKVRLMKYNPAQVFDYQELVNRIRECNQVYKSRLLGRVGNRSFFVDISDVAYFVADNKVVYLVAGDGTRYIVEHTLETLEKCLDPFKFFRLNRSMIVNAAAIQYIKPYINSRLKLSVKAGTCTDELIVSRERVPSFRTWADG